MQGEAERVTDLVAVLHQFYRDKLTQMLRHQAGARHVPQYDANNTYQYIINREETQLSWVGVAIAESGSVVDDSGAEPERARSRSGIALTRAILEEDALEAQAFVNRWQPRVEAMTHARHRGMLRVILAETIEQRRFFEQALAGQLDLLGRRTPEVGSRVGDVMPNRWVE